MGALGEYLAQCGRRARKAGEHDCCTFPAGWAMLCGRPDPMAEWRGTYASEAEAEDLIYGAGGLLVLFSEGLADCPVVDEPREGDIGVIDIMGEQAGAIFTGKRWAVVADRGLAFASLDPAQVLRIWRP